MSRTRINSKWLSNCTIDELKQMNRLRFKGDSMMYTDVLKERFNRELIRIFFLKHAGKIIGWSSVLRPITKKAFKKNPMYVIPPGNYAPVYTYVNSSYRGRSYGQRLLLTGSRWAKTLGYKPIVFYHDDKSQAFFNKATRTFRDLEVRAIEDWSDVIEKDASCWDVFNS